MNRGKNQGILRRTKKPLVKDTRFVMGTALVVGSMALGGMGFSAATKTVPIVVADQEISAGEAIDPTSLHTVNVRVGSNADAYVSDIAQIPEGSLATRSIGSGEFLAKSSVGQDPQSAVRPVALDITDPAADSLARGAVVDVWQGKDDGGEAEMLLQNAVVRSVEKGGGLGGKHSRVEVYVPKEQVANVLNALDSKRSVYVIEVPGHFEVTR